MNPGLPTPRYVIDEINPCVMVDRWRASHDKLATYTYESHEDATAAARVAEENLGASILIAYRHAERGIEIRPIIPLDFNYLPPRPPVLELRGSPPGRHRLRTRPGRTREDKRRSAPVPLSRILGWDT